MGSHPTLAHQPPEDPTARAAEAFEQLNPALADFIDPDDPHASRERLRTVEDLDARGYRAWVNEANENPPTPIEVRRMHLRERTATAHPTTCHLERAFDQLNPDFGVPADLHDPIGHHDVAQREAALALGVRVAIHDSRQNDPNPHIWQAGQDYRMANAIHTARHHPTRTRGGPERTGPER